MSDLHMLPLDSIQSSPYQARKGFSEESLAALADSMRGLGLIQPILCRPMNGSYQLVAGERRVRAARILGWDVIAATVRPLTDREARLVTLSENLQRDDLTRVEEIEGLAEYIDATMDAVEGYREFLDAALKDRAGGPRITLDLNKAIDRTTWFLSLCDSDRRTGTTKVSNTFVGNLEQAFSDLNRPVKWQSFYLHDLPIVRDLPEVVWQAAVKHKLSKSQTKALKRAYEEAPAEMAKMIVEGGIRVYDTEELVDIADLSAREITRHADQKTHRLISQSLTNEWYTPAEYIAAAREVMGGIDLDPATSTMAQRWIQAGEFYTADDDGLAREWHGRIWLNPPWGDLTGKFIAKLDSERRIGNVIQAVVLVNAHATDAAWFASLWDGLLCFTDHRINYISPDGDKESGSTHGSVFIYFGPHEDRFVRLFKQWGAIVRRVGDDD